MFVQESTVAIPTTTVPAAPRAQIPPAPTMPLLGNLTLEECTNVIQFGEKHRGKSLAEVMQKDPAYLQWTLLRYHSLMPDHPDFVQYGQLWLKEIGNGM